MKLTRLQPSASAAKVLPAAPTANGAVTVLVPPGPVMARWPAASVAGATAVMRVGETTVNEAAATPLNATAVAAVKLAPVTVTLLPAANVAGATDATSGA